MALTKAIPSMFLQHYGLREDPFGVTPDPRFLYLTETNREALATLEYGIRCNRGFVVLIAPPGLGKTTLLYYMLQQCRISNTANTAFIFQTQCTSRELLRNLIQDLELGSDCQDIVQMQHQLNEFLVRYADLGKQVVIFIDEAQNLSEEALETVRLLSNFETSRSKLLQIVLAGQPALADHLNSPNLLQLRQRVFAMVNLEPFTPIDTDRYIDHRLGVAGYSGKLFTPEARALLIRSSEGIPRDVNSLAFKFLSLGLAKNTKLIDASIAREVLEGKTDCERPKGRENCFSVSPHIRGVGSSSKRRELTSEDDEHDTEACAVTLEPPPERPNAPAPEQVSTSKLDWQDGAKAVSVAQTPALSELAEAKALRGVPSTTVSSGEDLAGMDKLETDPKANVDFEMDNLRHYKLSNEAEAPRPETPWPNKTSGAMAVGIVAVLVIGSASVLWWRQSSSSAIPAQLRLPSAAELLQSKAAAGAPPTGFVKKSERRLKQPVSGSSTGTHQPVNPQPANLATSASTNAPTPMSRPNPDKAFIPAGTASGASPTPVAIGESTNAPRDRPPLATAGGSESAMPQVTRAQPSIADTPHEPLASAPTPNPGKVPIESAATEPLVIDTEQIAPVTSAVLMRSTTPSYPELAKRMGLEGKVELKAIVDTDGKVKRPERVSGNPLLADAAIWAVRDWSYRPATVNGKPVASETRIVLRFTLRSKP